VAHRAPRIEEEVMMELERTALGAAVASSVLSLGDAVLRATSDTVPPWDDEQGTAWGTSGVGILLGVTFALLTAVLVRNATAIDGGSGARRWIRRALAVDLGILAAGSLVATVVESEVVGGAAGVTFLAMFVLGEALGLGLLGRPETRVPGALMASATPVIGLTFALEALAPGWGHPGYAETVLYLGIALLGIAATTVRESGNGSLVGARSGSPSSQPAPPPVMGTTRG